MSYTTQTILALSKCKIILLHARHKLRVPLIHSCTFKQSGYNTFGLYLICERSALRHHVYKSERNLMDVL